MRTSTWGWVGAAVWVLSVNGAAAASIVIGQSLPLGASDDGNARRIVEGTRALVEAVNAKGGVNGRPVQVVTLDNGNDPAHETRNVRQLHGVQCLHLR